MIVKLTEKVSRYSEEYKPVVVGLRSGFRDCSIDNTTVLSQVMYSTVEKYFFFFV